MASSFGVVEPLWLGETVVCIGGGPSLTQADVDYCRGKAKVIAVNDAYKLASGADAFYAHDWQWLEYHCGLPNFAGLKFTCASQVHEDWNITRLLLGHEMGLSDNPTKLNHGKNSGYQAINLAVHLGARRILLLGYDMQKSSEGKRHWFGEHPKEITSKVAWGTSMPFDYWMICYQSLVKPLQARGIDVINCSRRTALTCFPQMSIEEALSVVAA